MTAAHIHRTRKTDRIIDAFEPQEDRFCNICLEMIYGKAMEKTCSSKKNEVLKSKSSLLFHIRIEERIMNHLEIAANAVKAMQIYSYGILKYLNEFMSPYWISLSSFNNLEKEKLAKSDPMQTLSDYLNLFLFNLQVYQKGLQGTLSTMNVYHNKKLEETSDALINMILNKNGHDLSDIIERQTKLLHKVVYEYPQAILAVKPDYGFHFEDKNMYIKAAETDRFELWQVLPTEGGKPLRDNGKPILILPPYVLGPNILAFLPKEKKSYVHSFANMGIPTYIRIIKDIDLIPAVQTMTGDDDARDARYFCEILYRKHGHPVTLNGFCQGGFVAMADILSGELDGLVDALITCVSPMDGTRSKALVEYLQHLPDRFRDLGYATKPMENGNRVVDGTVMSWVYKLKSMEREAPILAFYRDLAMFDRPDGSEVKINKTAAAINYWLIYDRTDLPLGITQMSFDSYTIPVEKDGTLPVKLFGRRLNFHRMKEKDIRYLICYAAQDDLVDKPAALAPLDFIDAEVTVFPKGHGAIATSWSQPTSECALHSVFGKEKYRGPVRFQLDLEEESDKS